MLNITTREESGVMILDMKGQIDGGPESKKIQELIKKKIEDGTKKFLLNMEEIRWLNSLGAGDLIATFVSAKREDARIKLLNITDRVGTVLKTCGLIPEVFESYKNENEALNSF
jgi:anti-anti-sigma factor